jgi:hypothetical protein
MSSGTKSGRMSVKFPSEWKQSKLNNLANVKPEIQTLLDRGNITLKEMLELQCNSYEWELIYLKLNDEAFVHQTEHILKNCHFSSHHPLVTYNDVLGNVMVPELLKRFKAASFMSFKSLSNYSEYVGEASLLSTWTSKQEQHTPKVHNDNIHFSGKCNFSGCILPQKKLKL